MNRNLITLLIASSLGYFVDLYDLLIFSVVRTQSLKALGVSDEHLLTTGLSLLNWMLAGMMLGGIFWGILGDKKGRLSVLFGSILCYSLANLMNAYIDSILQYKILRFIAGFGLAGELGAGITLISEIMSPQKRGYGTMIIAAIGMLGAAFAAFVGQYADWRFAFKLGAWMGFALLIFRLNVKESSLFLQQKNSNKGNIIQLLFHANTRMRFIKLILTGTPLFFVIGILITATPEFAKAMGMIEIPSTAWAILYTYLAISFGDIVCTYLSQVLKSRNLSIMIFVVMSFFSILFYLFFPSESPVDYYVKCALMGFGIGYLGVLVTHTAEHFGTNLRATATIAAPNFIRGLLPLFISPLFLLMKGKMDLLSAAVITSIVCCTIAFTALYFTEDRYGTSMDWEE